MRRMKLERGVTMAWLATALVLPWTGMGCDGPIVIMPGPGPDPAPAPAPVPDPGPGGGISAACRALALDPGVNWRETSLTTDQQIVECLSRTLGRAVGYGENASGGFDPAGGSRLTIIRRNAGRSVEQQILDALGGDAPNWIVFDKEDFAQEFEVGLYRVFCSDPTLQGRLGASQAECVDFRRFCANRGIPADQCLDEFFNRRLNDSGLPIRNIEIGSNKTLDGRFSQAFFLFSGFSIGREGPEGALGASRNVILTHLDFRGAGKVEDHELDPDMIRSTSESSDIWIHKNDFDLTGDSAFDVKRGARNITISFNRVVDVERAALHGSSDSRVVNENIRTTLHNNAFVTRDERYLLFGNTGRRVPLIRRGSTHLFNNFFMNYRKDVLSVRVGASVLFEDNLFLVNDALREKDSVPDALAELAGRLVRDVEGGNFASSGTAVAFATRGCVLDPGARLPFSVSSGDVRDLLTDYSVRSQTIIRSERLATTQALVDYTNATAGDDGAIPFNSPLSPGNTAILQQARRPCQ